MIAFPSLFLSSRYVNLFLAFEDRFIDGTASSVTLIVMAQHHLSANRARNSFKGSILSCCKRQQAILFHPTGNHIMCAHQIQMFFRLTAFEPAIYLLHRQWHLSILPTQSLLTTCRTSRSLSDGMCTVHDETLLARRQVTRPDRSLFCASRARACYRKRGIVRDHVIQTSF